MPPIAENILFTHRRFTGWLTLGYLRRVHNQGVRATSARLLGFLGPSSSANLPTAHRFCDQLQLEQFNANRRHPPFVSIRISIWVNPLWFIALTLGSITPLLEC